MKKILGAISVLVICGLLVAGLWPFDLFSRNRVSWLRDGNGIQFSENGTIYSRGEIEVTKPDKESSCSLELWLQPAARYSKHGANILGFYTSDNPLRFRLRQERQILRLKRDYQEQRAHLQTIIADVEHAFRPDEQALFTITASPKGTSVYRNGSLINVFPRFGLSCNDFSGQLVIGGSPIAPNNNWQGKLLGVAIYERQLAPEQVVRHYTMWTQQATPEAFKNDRALALYSFAERSGRVVHNCVVSKPELYIPRIFAIPHKKILALPWEEFSPDQNMFQISWLILQALFR